MSWCQIRRSLSWLLLLGGVVFFLLVAQGAFQVPSAAAMVREFQEAPGQMLYQSRETLRGQGGSTWQAIAFRRVQSEEAAGPYLRIVGFPGVVNIDQAQPLQIKPALGKGLEAANVSQEIFEDRPTESPGDQNVAQYDLQAIVPQLNPFIPLRLSIPTMQGTSVQLSVSPQVAQDWKAIAAHP